jgi:hypothetical protein
VVQSIVFTNKFNVPLTIFSAELDDPHFEVVKSASGLTAQPGATWPPVTIRFLANRTDMMYATELALATNVSVLRVPLHCYHGHLSYSVLDTTEPTGVRTWRHTIPPLYSSRGDSAADANAPHRR